MKDIYIYRKRAILDSRSIDLHRNEDLQTIQLLLFGVVINRNNTGTFYKFHKKIIIKHLFISINEFIVNDDIFISIKINEIYIIRMILFVY